MFAMAMWELRSQDKELNILLNFKMTAQSESKASNDARELTCQGTNHQTNKTFDGVSSKASNHQLAQIACNTKTSRRCPGANESLRIANNCFAGLKRFIPREDWSVSMNITSETKYVYKMKSLRMVWQQMFWCAGEERRSTWYCIRFTIQRQLLHPSEPSQVRFCVYTTCRSVYCNFCTDCVRRSLEEISILCSSVCHAEIKKSFRDLLTRQTR